MSRAHAGDVSRRASSRTGRPRRVVAAPLHPYTRALVAAVPMPRVDQSREPLPIRGNMPDARNPPSGCRFHDRCPACERALRRARSAAPRGRAGPARPPATSSDAPSARHRKAAMDSPRSALLDEVDLDAPWELVEAFSRATALAAGGRQQRRRHDRRAAAARTAFRSPSTSPRSTSRSRSSAGEVRAAGRMIARSRRPTRRARRGRQGRVVYVPAAVFANRSARCSTRTRIGGRRSSCAARS